MLESKTCVYKMRIVSQSTNSIGPICDLKLDALADPTSFQIRAVINTSRNDKVHETESGEVI